MMNVAMKSPTNGNTRNFQLHSPRSTFYGLKPSFLLEKTTRSSQVYSSTWPLPLIWNSITKYFVALEEILAEDSPIAADG